jgi:hypothetical protein
LTGLGTVELAPDGTWEDAEQAARIVLADVGHRLEVARGLGRRPAGCAYSGRRGADPPFAPLETACGLTSTTV